VLEHFGRLVFRTRWIVLAIWLAVFAGSAVVAPRVTGVLHGGGYTIGNSDSVRAYDRLHHAYGYKALIFTAVFADHNDPGQRLLAAARSFRRHVLQVYRSQLSVSTPVLSSDGAIAIARVYSNPRADFGAGFAAPMRSMLAATGVRSYLAGPSAIFHDMEVVSDDDLHHVELVTLPIALLVLLVIFGSVIASLTPVLMAPVAVTLSLAVIYVVGHRIDMSIFVLNTTSMLGLGVAIDYSLFMVNRFREELALGRDLETAVGYTVATSGRAILVSAVVVSVGFYALTLSGVQMLESLGIGGSIVTALSLLTALTLLPAILGVLGPRINMLPVVPARLSSYDLWRRIALNVMRYPVPVILGVMVVVAALAAPAFHLRVGIPGPEILPPAVDSRAGNDLLNQHLGRANHSPVLVVATRDPGTPSSTYQSAAFTLLDQICGSPEVAGISSVPVPDSARQLRSCTQTLQALQRPTVHARSQAQALARQQNTGLISVFLRSDPSSAAAERYVLQLRRQARVPGYQVLIGGQTAGQMDFNNYLYSRFPLVALFVIVTIFVVLLFAFRSVLLPLKAVLMNIFSILAAYGAVVFAFQDGHLAQFLGFTSVGNIDSIVPVLLFCVLFGISTDYEIFLLSRVQEEYRLRANNEESVAIGLKVTGRIITSAAAVMVVVFGAFAFAQLVVIKEVGLGLAVAVLIDATLIRALLVPATMRLLGRWNWWLPGRGFMKAAKVRRPLSAVGHPPGGE